MTTATEKKTRPTDGAIDDMCLKFDEAKIAVENAERKYSEAKGELMVAVQEFGYQPEGAPKTVRLEGTIYVADKTTASSNTVVEPKIAELQSELSRLKLAKTFPELFDTTVKHSLKKDAGATLKLRIGALKPGKQAHLLALFAQCLDVQVKTPSLSVDLVAVLREKEAEAQRKAEAKAAREAKKAAKAKKGGE